MLGKSGFAYILPCLFTTEVKSYTETILTFQSLFTHVIYTSWFTEFY